MKLSNVYTIYPGNERLEQAVERYLSLIPDVAETSLADSDLTVMDNFRHTRGNYEQHRFNANVYAEATEAFEAALTDQLKEQDVVAWVALQNDLGNVLAAIGQQQRDEDLYKRAIAAFNSALGELSQGALPTEWATTLYNLGTASQALGRLARDAKSLKIAVDAYTKALMVWTRDASPEQWMRTMQQLGLTLHEHGRYLKGNRTFQKSVVAFKNALAVLDADNYALELTATHNNRGSALLHLGESEENPERVKEAIKAYEKALTVSMEQQLPFHLAVICRVNKATAQNVLAALTADVALAEEVADEFDLILECFPHALQPLCAQHCSAELGKARLALGRSE
ncbi:hypothetical protein HUS23_08755 [Ectothiorhodospiraceae bacterium 2226]|nr:hypothetical protein HUS23_08755 [Ectothiorhodospiraceae bacterium 2226]